MLGLADRSTLVALAAAFSVAALATALVRWMAPRLGVVAAPRADRWHDGPVPLLGGIGIFAGLLAGLWVGAPHEPAMLPVLAAGVLGFTVGAVDDVLPLKPSTKLLAQIGLACVALVLGGGRAWFGVPGARCPGEPRLDRGHHQRLQPDRQHRRPVCRRRRHRRDRVRGEPRALAERRGRVRGGGGRRVRRLPAAQLSEGRDLHGRLGQPAARRHARHADPAGRTSRRTERDRAARDSRPADGHPALRRRLRHAHADPGGPVGSRRWTRSRVPSPRDARDERTAGGAAAVRRGDHRGGERDRARARTPARGERAVRPAAARRHPARGAPGPGAGVRGRGLRAAPAQALHAAAGRVHLQAAHLRGAARLRARRDRVLRRVPHPVRSRRSSRTTTCSSRRCRSSSPATS